MSLSDDARPGVRVMPVPLQMVPDVWEAALPHLVRGDEAANSNPVKLLLDLVSGHAVLWLVFVSDNLVAAYFSSIHIDDDGRKSLMVYGLGGGRLRVWLNTMICKMEAHALANGCAIAAFHGVAGWGRLTPGYKSTPVGDGVALYEKVLA